MSDPDCTCLVHVETHDGLGVRVIDLVDPTCPSHHADGDAALVWRTQWAARRARTVRDAIDRADRKETR